MAIVCGMTHGYCVCGVAHDYVCRVTHDYCVWSDLALLCMVSPMTIMCGLTHAYCVWSDQ